jgi:hypothetical protein
MYPSDQSLLLHAVTELWLVPPPAPKHLLAMPEFQRLRDRCQILYPDAGGRQSLALALSTILRRLGLPCLLAPEDAHLSLAPEAATQAMDAAFRCTTSKRIHLCPLDRADNIPSLTFGPNRVRRYSASELDEIVDPRQLRHTNQGWLFDSRRFSNFSWLIVKEDIQLDGRPGARAVPALFENLGQDFGRIEPHKPRLPPAVEAALFGLLTAPWEDLVEYRDIDWRGFHIPWVYTIDNDIFARSTAPPSPDTLSWEPYFDQSGEETEYEQPTTLRLVDGVESDLEWLNDEAWSDLTGARKSPILSDLVAHFFVGAFLSKGIDEFLAHITTIEAAVGLAGDYGFDDKGQRIPKKVNLKSPIGNNLPPSVRVERRVAGLLGAKSYGDTYGELFHLRSRFLHGRSMNGISGNMRLAARQVARKVVCALIDAAIANPAMMRDSYLEKLLADGIKLNESP